MTLLGVTKPGVLIFTLNLTTSLSLLKPQQQQQPQHFFPQTPRTTMSVPAAPDLIILALVYIRPRLESAPAGTVGGSQIEFAKVTK